jgi:hypothetical protein
MRKNNFIWTNKEESCIREYIMRIKEDHISIYKSVKDLQNILKGRSSESIRAKLNRMRKIFP